MPVRTVTTPDGVDLHVVELGPPGAPPLVVLHGGPAAHHDYLLPGFAVLADRRRLVLYDQRGGGRSRAPAGADLGIEAHLADVGTVLDALGLGRVDLAGYSFGGLYAMRFAARHPGRVDRLVPLSSVPPHGGYREGLDAALAAAQQDERVLLERRALEASGLREAEPEEYRRRRFALSVAGYFADPRHAHALHPFRVQARAAEAVRASLGDFDFRAELGAIDGRRTLVVHGDRDPIDPRFARETAGLLGARLELLEACGHVPFVENPRAFAGILDGFLGG